MAEYKKWALDKVCFIEIECNRWNGFFLNFLHIDLRHMEASVFGIQLSERFFYIEILFITIEIFNKDKGKF
jgi:hypothetical protein